MKSASQMSALIRAKKKLNKKDPDMLPEIDQGSMDLQDVENERLKDLTEDHDENESAESEAVELAEGGEVDEDPAKLKRKARLAAMMSKR